MGKVGDSMDVEKIEGVEDVEAGTDPIEEEDVTELQTALDEAESVTDPATKIPLLLPVIKNLEKVGPAATQIKERAVYDLVRAYCSTNQYDSIVTFLADNEAFLGTITKAKTAKLVRHMLDIVLELATPINQERVARSLRAWCEKQKRSFLRQRITLALAQTLYSQRHYAEATTLIADLLKELKKLDDKQLLVETHLLESQLCRSVHNHPSAKAALTACRTAAHAIYVTPQTQAAMDAQSGVLYTHERDYATAHSYFLEAFEQLDSSGATEKATTALKYMMLCKILDGLQKSLSGHTKTASTDESKNTTASMLLTHAQALAYAGPVVDAMQAISAAAASRNVQDLEAALADHHSQLADDPLIEHHLGILQEQLLESNLLRIIEPYSVVQVDFVASQLERPVTLTERKLSQMILDGTLSGTLDQGRGVLIVYESDDGNNTNSSTVAMKEGLEVLGSMDEVVTALFARSKQLQSVML